MRRIAIVGPESSGKTTLALELSERLGAAAVPEAARAFLTGLGRPYAEADLLTIAKLQVEREELEADASGRSGSGLLLCDTDLLTIRIWSEEKFGRCDPWIVAECERRRYDLWLLCRPDIPWEPDPLRENPHDRERLFVAYASRLQRLARPFRIIEGTLEQRLATAWAAILQLPD
ncbi:MAG: ATP-binding protein [Flavobacteriales bacterium]|nr:MAG: ATP-binding protein [Flavobacteriales bacterium]